MPLWTNSEAHSLSRVLFDENLIALEHFNKNFRNVFRNLEIPLFLPKLLSFPVNSLIIYSFLKQRRRQDLGSGRDILGVGLVGCPGAEPPGRRRILENFQKFLKKIAKCIILAYFSKKINKNA